MLSASRWVKWLEQFCVSFFFFNDTATTEIYTLSLHDALPISRAVERRAIAPQLARRRSSFSPALRSIRRPKRFRNRSRLHRDRKSTRLNSSHDQISYAVFCLKKKKPPTRRPNLVAYITSLITS